MTNEQAIELLHRLQDEQFDGIHGDERREALEMAIRALEGDGDMISRQAVMKEFSDFVRKSNNSDFAPTPTWNDAVSLVGSMPSAQIAIDINVGDTIYRQEAIDAVSKWLYDVFGIKKSDGTATIFKRLRELPSAQPQRKTGRWLPDNNCYYETRYMCSECKLPFHVETIMMKPSWRFCPNCGARMEGESDE